MSELWAAVLLALVSAVCYATGAVVQERLAATTPPSRYRLLKSGRWWTAVALNGTGALLHAAALGLGPLTVVQPLGVLTLVLAAPLAALLVKRPVGAASRRGIALVSVGLAVLLSLTGSATSRALSGGEQLVLITAVGSGLTVLIVTALATRRAVRPVRTVALASAAGVAYGAASVFVKTVADGWGSASVAASLPVFLLIAFLAATGLAASQASYRGGGLATPLATATVVNPAVAATVGILLLGEGFRYGTAGGLGALAGALVTCWGLFVLASGGELQAARLAQAAAASPAPPRSGASRASAPYPPAAGDTVAARVPAAAGRPGTADRPAAVVGQGPPTPGVPQRSPSSSR